MDRSASPRSLSQTISLRTETIAYLLQKGLRSIQQGYDTDGITTLRLAHELLAVTHTSLALLLDTFIKEYLTYRQIWQALQEASLRFAQAHAEQQSRTATLTTMLEAFLQGSDATPALGEAIPAPSIAEIHAELLPRLMTPHISSAPDSVSLPELSITCFGHFTIMRAGKAIPLCSSRKGQGIMRYLVTQPDHSATADKLMAQFWPDEDVEIAQSKLHIAISALRRSLNQGYQCEPGGGYIICKNGVYSLNPDAVLRIDVDEFLYNVELGRQSVQHRIDAYERACQLYTGPFLHEDLYADWSRLLREQLSQHYVTMCGVLAHHYLHLSQYEEAAKWATAMLKEAPCEETAHQHLMRIFLQQGRRRDALKQYQLCVEILRDELGVQPLPETRQIIQPLLVQRVPDIAER